MTKQNVLKGKTISAVMLATDRKAILFKTAEGRVVAKCYGDCCSNTWIENVELPVNGFPAVVISADYIDLPDLGNGDAECIQYYGFKVVTDKGDIIIDYRNESNGYYGGGLSWPNHEDFYEGVKYQNNSNEEWLDLTEAA